MTVRRVQCRERRLTYVNFTAKLKFIAEAIGLDPRVISTHSLRIAGESAVAAKGVPDHVV